MLALAFRYTAGLAASSFLAMLEIVGNLGVQCLSSVFRGFKLGPAV